MLLPVSPAPEQLTLVVTGDSSTAFVTAAGEVDSFSAPQLTAALHNAVVGAAVEVVVNLEAVTFLDSAGVHALADAYRLATSHGTRLRVMTSRRAVLRPLELSGLWPLLGS